MERLRKYGFVAGFLAVPVALYSVFVISPYIQAFQISLTDWNGYRSRLHYIGLDNFTRLFGDEVFWQALRNHGILLLVLPLVTIAIALFFAFLLNVGGGKRGAANEGGLGVEVLSGGVLLPPGPRRGRHRRAVQDGVPARRVRPDQRRAGQAGPRSGRLPDRAEPRPLGDSSRCWSGRRSASMWCSSPPAWPPSRTRSTRRPSSTARRGRAVLPRHAAAAAGTPSRSPGSTWASRRSTRSPSSVLAVDNGGPDGATTVLRRGDLQTAFTYSQYGYASAMGVALFFLTITFAALTLRPPGARRSSSDMASTSSDMATPRRRRAPRPAAEGRRPRAQSRRPLRARGALSSGR